MVEGSGFENRRRATYRGFESLRLRESLRRGPCCACAQGDGRPLREFRPVRRDCRQRLGRFRHHQNPQPNHPTDDAVARGEVL